MGLTNKIAMLPPEVRSEINRRLRESQYLGQVEIRDWLESEGYVISRSALSRYARTLKEEDGMADKNSYQLAAQEGARYGLSRRESILIELGEMKVREAELLAELRDLAGQTEA